MRSSANILTTKLSGMSPYDGKGTGAPADISSSNLTAVKDKYAMKRMIDRVAAAQEKKDFSLSNSKQDLATWTVREQRCCIVTG
jgi:hypothetical protein